MRRCFYQFSAERAEKTPTVLKQAFIRQEDNVKDLVKTFVSLSDHARKHGLLSLDDQAREIRDPFLKKGLLLAVDGWDEETIRLVMDSEIAAMEERHRKGRRVLEKAGNLLRRGA